ncbi:hypothetical protein Bca52824_070414 [Brassica carinata]|uniref:HMA domain-containing protein n=1 Tax=Brassica carinata TaxID=52824 RepID=A0A8X7Q6V1_BRACI|nr:hypothetical protein Bca52824_070414 [Brassica carinata]
MNCCCPLNITISTLDVELKIPDCNRCEKDMIDAISDFKGVESCTTDTENQKIAVSGSFNLEKLLKKLKKVTGEDVEIVEEEKKDPEPEIVEIDAQPEVVFEPNSDEQKEIEKYMMFSDENPNAKCTMS